MPPRLRRRLACAGAAWDPPRMSREDAIGILDARLPRHGGDPDGLPEGTVTLITDNDEPAMDCSCIL